MGTLPHSTAKSITIGRCTVVFAVRVAGSGIDGKDGDVVRSRIAGEQEAAGRIDVQFTLPRATGFTTSTRVINDRDCRGMMQAVAEG